MKFTEKELNAEGIRQWNWIEKDFDKCPILLGNGFSLNFSDTLSYKSLYDNFISESSEDSKALFTEFDTSNFELVLQHLESTDRVLQALKETSSKLEDIKNEVRQGLIDSINRIHPTPDQINQAQITFVAEQFQRFSNIYTTNYDLFLYYIVLESNKFGDYFYYKFFDDERFNLFNQGDTNNSHHIYYLHGALFLFINELNTIKIKKDEEHWLIYKITKEITDTNYPLFISEGSSSSKLKSIQASGYLSYCFRNLQESKEKKLVIFGQSLSEQDLHIAQAIDKNFEKIAISIRPQNWSNIKALKAEKNRISSLFKNAEFDFFDSNSIFKFYEN